MQFKQRRKAAFRFKIKSECGGYRMENRFFVNKARASHAFADNSPLHLCSRRPSDPRNQIKTTSLATPRFYLASAHALCHATSAIMLFYVASTFLRHKSMLYSSEDSDYKQFCVVFNIVLFVYYFIRFISNIF